MSNEIDPTVKAMTEVAKRMATDDLKKSEKKGKTMESTLVFVDPMDTTLQYEGEPTLVKSITNILNGGSETSIERLAFESNPSVNNNYAGLYKAKYKLLPDYVLKRISIQDDLVASIVNARGNHVGSFGRPRNDRFSLGFEIKPKTGVMENMNDAQQQELQKRIDAMEKRFSTCGDTKGWSDQDQMTFSQYLSMSTRDAITVGRLATEIVWVQDSNGNKIPHSFRPIDAGTIYRATPQKEAAQSVRDSALTILQQIHNKKLIPEKFQNDEYAWIQVVDGRPVQAFTSEECLVYNFYPVTYVELDGYPLTPLDTVIAAVTTHINITTHNKMYFQTGRATRGMLVIKSEDVDEGVISRIRQQFNASINSVNNAWRMPVFGLAPNDDIVWQSIDSGGRDAEFQYLSDSNARCILSAFQMSPDELPGYSHLSRGTNSQALSESNNEYKMQAARDVGIKPLLKHWEDFLNARILPVFDENLAKLVSLRLVGLDAETAEKESVRIQQDMPIHMTYDEVLTKVEKDPVGKEWAGEFPINPQWQQILDNHSGLTVGEIAAHFMGRPELAKRPDLQYVRDPMWFQWQQLQDGRQQMQMAQQQQEQAAQQQQAQGQQPQPGQEQQGQEQGQEQAQKMEPDLTRSIDQALGLLTKSEKQLPETKKRILALHKAAVDGMVKGIEADIEELTKQVVKVAKTKAPK